MGGLPAELSSFVGRRAEVGEVRKRLAGARLVTLTGLGGSGKTRLALRVAAGVRRAYRDRVWFLDLTHLPAPEPFAAEAHHAEALAYLTAATLGLRGQEREPLRSLAAQLADTPTLLVMDNCEHLIPACVVVLGVLLGDCPGLRVLATSREPLAIPGETVFPVPPLPVPDPRRSPGSAELARCESVALFVARGQTVVRGFDLTGENQSAVAGICHRLDGLPLAIELAAARLRVMTPQQILDRLDQRFTLLSRGNRAGPERHQTLHACVAWSFELCGEPERLLWSRLAVFAGGFDLDAVEDVCADDLLTAPGMLDALTGLVDKSILVREEDAGPARYRMLTTLRDYGLLQLRETGGESTFRLRHAQSCLSLAERAERHWFGPDQIGWCRRIRLEHANLLAAFEFLLHQPAHRHRAVRLAASLWFYWLVFGQASEGYDWLTRALRATTGPTPERAKALWACGHLATVRGDLDAATGLLRQAAALAREAGDELTEARAAKRLAAVAMHRGDLDRAAETLAGALARLRVLDGAQASAAHAQLALALTRFLRGDHAEAVRLCLDLRTACQEQGDRYVLAHTLNLLGRAEFTLGDLRAAAEHVREAVRAQRALPDAVTLLFSVDLLSWITAAAGDHERAATLAGAAGNLWKGFGSSVHRWRFVGEAREQWERRIRCALGDAAYQAAAGRGTRFTVGDLIPYALTGRAVPARKLAADRPDAVLTSRERQIAELVADGLSNRDIAARLVVSRRTAESHVEHILRKLAFTSRVQVAAWIQRIRDDTRQPGA